MANLIAQVQARVRSIAAASVLADVAALSPLAQARQNPVDLIFAAEVRLKQPAPSSTTLTKARWIAEFVAVAGVGSATAADWAWRVAKQEWELSSQLLPAAAAEVALRRVNAPPTQIRLRWDAKLHDESGFGHSPWKLDIHENRVELRRAEAEMNDRYGAGSHWIEWQNL